MRLNNLNRVIKISNVKKVNNYIYIYIYKEEEEEEERERLAIGLLLMKKKDMRFNGWHLYRDECMSTYII